MGIAAADNSPGYWLVGADGGVFAYGGAGFFGSAATIHLNAPIVGIAATADAVGYYLVAADGGVFAFGDADFRGSMGGRHLRAPVVGIATDPLTGGYRLAAADGGVFDFGAPFLGSEAGRQLYRPVVGIATDLSSGGYWLGASDGGVFAFGATFFGGLGGASSVPVIGISSAPDEPYFLADRSGNLFEFSVPLADRHPQANLRDAHLNAEAVFQADGQSFPSPVSLVAALTAAEPSLSFTTGASTAPTRISVTTSTDGSAVILAARATTGNCWYSILNTGSAETSSPPWSAPGAVFVEQGTYWGEVKNTGTPPTCQASSAPAGANSATQAFSTTGLFPIL